eukprot:CAMPEP_0115606844 /NCGR_PEP_ID=MMETSP0272-20121206/18200_1 /TAXON_ID=71861 /ORGANISM="Scrippsiella trochoidea, Strain CCMP3099" /LENGTH=284 /DNA_ID=CAMNT_0003042505 /DNA_START=64 /DNA_END=919 /DNA_ORIENTATION=-
MRPFLSTGGPKLDTAPNKMLADAKFLNFGTMSDFLVGLRVMLGKCREHNGDEFTGRPVQPWSDQFGSGYIARDLWHRARVAARSLRDHPAAKAAKLTEEDITALRAYTGPAYRPLNEFLRELGKARMLGEDSATAQLLAPDKTWAATAVALDSAFTKLLKAAEVSGSEELLRGVKGKLPTEFYIPDERGMIVMTDHGFVSTTRNPAVAKTFGSDGSTPSVLMRLKTRKRDAFGYHSGVDLSWVSENPSENEVLFPPFTLMNVIRKHREGMRVTLVVVPTFAPYD